MINQFVVEYSLLNKKNDLGDNELTPEQIKTELGVWDYEQKNPHFTKGVCETLARRTCRHCYNRGVLHFNRPEGIKWMEACYCVKNALDKLDQSVKKAILGLQS